MSVAVLIKQAKKLPAAAQSAFDRQDRKFVDRRYRQEARRARQEFLDSGVTDEQIEKMVMDAVYELRYGRKP